MTINKKKRQIRQEMLMLRHRMPIAEKADQDRDICVQLIDLVTSHQCQVVHAFLPLPEEVDIKPALRYFLSQGLTVVCPRALRHGRLEHRRLVDLQQVEMGLFGTYHPHAADDYQGTYDLIIVPGLAFDRNKQRLGYGGGYYDAFLARHPGAYKVGVGYNFQQIEALPTTHHDVALDAVITPRKNAVTQWQTQRMTLSFMQPDHHQWYVQHVQQEEVMRYITGRALSAEEAEERFKKAIQLSEERPGFGFLVVQLKADGRFVGIAKFILDGPFGAEVGYSLEVPFWGQGLATELLAKLLRYAHEFTHLKQLIAIADPANAVSMHLLTKAGFLVDRIDVYKGLPAAFLSKKL